MTIILSAHDLVKVYPDVIAVDGIGFQVESGSCYGLLGPNGAGKTTTMELLEGIIQPDRGQILYQGRPIDSSFRHQIGIQFQSTSLLDFQTVQEALIMFSQLYDKTADLDELIELCHLQEFIKRDTRKLSGGQRQRIAIARAMLKNPPLLLLDEATSALDAHSERMVQAALESAMRGRTTLVIAHRLATVQQADNILVLEHGRLVEQGKHAALVEMGGVYAGLAALQFNA